MTLSADILTRMPHNEFDIAAMGNGAAHGDTLEAIYDRGFQGVFINSDENDQVFRDASKWLEDESEPLPEFGASAQLPPFRGTDGCHVYTQHAFNFHRLHGQHHVDKPFSIVQNRGNCVDASGTYADDYVMGVQVAYAGELSVEKYDFRFLSSFFHYGNRGYCSDGWYPKTRGNEVLKNGWCPATVIESGGNRVDLTREDDQENLTGRTWCGRGVPDWLESYTRANHRVAAGGVVAFDHDGSVSRLRDLFKQGGCFNHGSNRTGAGRPNSLKRIGGHAQTAFGGDWSDECLKWFRDEHGITYTEDDFPCPQGQQWGSWSGQTPDRYWPKHLWGDDVPVGFWLISAKQLVSGLFHGPAYVPGFSQGVPSTDPTPTPPANQWSTTGIQAELLPSGKIAIRGDITAPDGSTAIIVPDGAGAYKPHPKTVI